MRTRFFLSEALRALRRNAAPSFAAFATVLITTFTLGVFIPVVQAVSSKASDVKNQIQVEVFVNDEATDTQLRELTAKLEKLKNVETVEFISKEEALQRCPELASPEICDTSALTGENPLPASFLIKLDDTDKVFAVRDEIEPVAANGKRRAISRAIQRSDGVVIREREAKKILSATNTIKIVLGILVTLLLLASVLLVSNTIRLSIFARRREVEVMRLVGATNWFIRWPFVIEGLIVGSLAGVGAAGLLWATKVAFVDPLSERFALIAPEHTIAFSTLAVVLLAAAMIVSALGSGITLRRFLRI